MTCIQYLFVSLRINQTTSKAPHHSDDSLRVSDDATSKQKIATVEVVRAWPIQLIDCYMAAEFVDAWICLLDDERGIESGGIEGE